MLSSNFLRVAPRLCFRSQQYASSTIRETRPFSQSARSYAVQKGNEDKDSINVAKTEYSNSGTDDSAAKQDEAAYDPKTTSPEQEKDIAGKGNEVSQGATAKDSNNPLEVSPANTDVSQGRGAQEGGAEKSPDSKGRSGGGSPRKGKKLS